MKLSSIEKFYVNSFFRAYLHQPWILRFMLKHAPLHIGSEILEIGCGRGHGLKLLKQHLNPSELTGLDFDPQQVALASENTQNLGNSIHIRQGDAAALPFYETSFHAVFSFAAIHHVPDWHRAVHEAVRVLKPGGYLLLEEFYRGMLEAPVLRSAFPHPSDRFTHAEFLLALQQEGMTIVKDVELIKNGYGLVIARKDV